MDAILAAMGWVMIAVTSYVTGSHIAGEMIDDVEEAAQFFVAFAGLVDACDLTEFGEAIEDEVLTDDQKSALRKLGELLIEAAK